MINRFFYVNILIKGWVIFLFLVSSANAYEFPPYEGLDLKIEGHLAESYSNNITFAAEDEDRIEDLLTIMTVGMGIKYDRERRAFGLNGRLNRQMRTDSGDIENSSERASIDFRNEFSYYDRIKVNITYNHTQVPGTLDEGLDAQECQALEDQYGRELVRKIYPECDKFEEEFGRFTGKLDSYNTIANFNYDRNFNEQLSISTGYSYRQYWSPEEGSIDSYGNSLGFRINYGYSAATIFSLSYNYAESRYEEGDNISTQAVAMGFRQYITKLIYFNGRLGMDFNPHGNNSEIEASFIGQIDERTTANITYLKGDDISSDREDIFRNWRVTGGFTRELLEDLNSSFSGFYGQGEFVSLNVTDTLLGASINLDYSFWRDIKGKNIRGNLGYTYSDLDSTDESRAYSRSGIDLGLTVGF